MKLHLRKNRGMYKEIKYLVFSIILLGHVSAAFGQEFKTVGYLPTYRFYALDDLELEKITHLNISFANPNTQGKLTTDGVSIDQVVQKAHEAGVVVYIALAGAGAPLSTWAPWISPNARTSFISGIVEYVLVHDLQGVDVDLEWGTVNDDYSGFVLELRDALANYDLGLSAALPGTYRYPEITAEALTAFDWVNLMAYDLTGPWDPSNPGQHSPFSFARNSIDYWANQGLPKERMTLGVPFYGYDFTNLNSIEAVTFAQMVEMGVSNAQKDQVGAIHYNGLATIEDKTQLALRELSGVMIWELGQDNFGAYSLLDKIHETIKGSLTTSTNRQDEFEISDPYPNPVLDFTEIKVESLGSIELTIYNQTLNRIDQQDFLNVQTISVDMRNYYRGLYFITIKGATFIRTFKLIKM
ncbi:MAG: chitinase [Saprospiraceae bacterium]